MRTLAIWIALILAAVEAVLVFRLAFALGGANPANGFVDFIYDITGPLVSPFEGIARDRSVGGGGVFEPETLIAMVVYLVAAVLLMGLVWAVTAGPSPTGQRAVVTRTRSTQGVREE